ncbi:MAG: hypothetical protein R2728_07745 [Chitinophagales bacterium]
MQFKEVIGQQEIKQQLIKEVQSKRIPHAQLFLSRTGTGGLPMAIAFAQYLVCDNPSDIDSCGECPSCRKASQLIHPDIHFSFPAFTKKSGKPHFSSDYIEEWRKAIKKQPYQNEYDWLQFLSAGNKQGNITALECREIIRRLQFKSFEGKYKVQIIWMAESLGKEGNILLKLLEEPPEDTILILIAEEQELILNTILSRTQVKSFPDLTTEDIKAELLKQEIQEEKAENIAFLADGNYHKALELLKTNSTNIFEWMEIWLTASMNRQANDLVQFITKLSGEGREVNKQFFEYALHFFRECLALKYKSEDNVKLTLKEKSLAKKVWQIGNFERIARVIPLIEERHYHVERNVNTKYILMDLSIQTEKILRGKM